jgi:hypothetical protein
VQVFPRLMYLRNLRQSVQSNIEQSCNSPLAEALCCGLLKEICTLYLHIRMPSELRAVLKDMKTQRTAKKNPKLIKLQHL